MFPLLFPSSHDPRDQAFLLVRFVLGPWAGAMALLTNSRLCSGPFSFFGASLQFSLWPQSMSIFHVHSSLRSLSPWEAHCMLVVLSGARHGLQGTSSDPTAAAAQLATLWLTCPRALLRGQSCFLERRSVPVLLWVLCSLQYSFLLDSRITADHLAAHTLVICIRFF